MPVRVDSQQMQEQNHFVALQSHRQTCLFFGWFQQFLKLIFSCKQWKNHLHTSTFSKTHSSMRCALAELKSSWLSEYEAVYTWGMSSNRVVMSGLPKIHDSRDLNRNGQFLSHFLRALKFLAKKKKSWRRTFSTPTAHRKMLYKWIVICKIWE